MTSPGPTAPSPASNAPQAAHGSSGGTLARELADFLVELSIAMHKHAIYPVGHPLLAGAVDGVARRLVPLLLERRTLSIGVARRQLVIEGVATDPNHPLLQELAQRLHRHQLGAVKFMSGIEREELADVITTLASDPARAERPLGLDLETLATRWAHARLFSLTYEKLELLDDEEGDDDRMNAGRAAQLWVGLARAALLGDLDAGDHDAALEPAAVARAIDEHQREQAYDQVIVGYLLQIANELKSAEGAEAAALQKRVSKLVAALDKSTLERLLEMGGDATQRRRFVVDATQGMTADAVVDLVQAAAQAEQQTISHSLVRLFSKLAQHATTGSVTHRGEAERSLRDSVTRLISKWSLDDPNPDAYRAVLEAMVRSSPDASSGAAVECEPERLVQMGLEVGTLGAPVWRAVDRLCAERRLPVLLELLDGAPEGQRHVADALWRHLGERDVLRDELEAPRIDFALVQRLVRHLGLGAVQSLLDATDTVDDAKARERVYDLIAALGEEVLPFVARRLASARGPQLREMIVLLSRFAETPAEVDVRQLVRHPEPAVRREAVRLALRMPGLRDEALLEALGDSDERTTYVALQAAQERCPRAGIDLLRARLDGHDLAPALRPIAIRVAASVRTPETLHWLLPRVAMRTRFLGRYRLLPTTPETLAALASLAAGWATDPGAAPVLVLAAKSRESEVRLAVSGGPGAGAPRPSSHHYTTPNG